MFNKKIATRLVMSCLICSFYSAYVFAHNTPIQVVGAGATSSNHERGRLLGPVIHYPVIHFPPISSMSYALWQASQPTSAQLSAQVSKFNKNLKNFDAIVAAAALSPTSRKKILSLIDNFNRSMKSSTPKQKILGKADLLSKKIGYLLDDKFKQLSQQHDLSLDPLIHAFLGLQQSAIVNTALDVRNNFNYMPTTPTGNLVVNSNFVTALKNYGDTKSVDVTTLKTLSSSLRKKYAVPLSMPNPYKKNGTPMKAGGSSAPQKYMKKQGVPTMGVPMTDPPPPTAYSGSMSPSFQEDQ